MSRKQQPPRPCFSCQKTIDAPYGPQKYCAECSRKINWARKNEWARRHHKETWQKRRVKSAEEYSARRSLLKKLGSDESAKSAKGILWDSNMLPVLVNELKLKIPFTYALSKNFQWGYHQAGYVHLRSEARAARDGLTAAIVAAKPSFVQGKIWVDICVQKPEQRGDAVNFVDAICDAVKKGIGIDDRWFSLRRVDWQVVKEDPWIIVSIGQEYTEPHNICSYCGALKHFSKFTGKKKIGKECRDCRQKIRGSKPADLPTTS